MKTNLIYGLRDPRNDVYKYIGKTTVGNSRPLQHLLKSHNQLVNDWVKELNDLGLSPHVDIIEKDIELNELAEKEKFYIRYFSEMHEELFNGGNHVFDNISNSPSIPITDIKTAINVLLNLGDVHKTLKLSSGMSDDDISLLLNIGRKTTYKIKQNDLTVMTETVLNFLILTSYSPEDVYNFYYSKSNEFVGDYPDNIHDFKIRCVKDPKFATKWYSKFINDKNVPNKINFNKRSKKTKL